MHAYRVGEAHGDAERIKADTMYSSLTFLIGTIGGVIMGPLLLSLGFSVPLLLAGGAGLNTVVAVYVGLLMFVSEPEEEGGPEASGAKKLSYRAATEEANRVYAPFNERRDATLYPQFMPNGTKLDLADSDFVEDFTYTMPWGPPVRMCGMVRKGTKRPHGLVRFVYCFSLTHYTHSRSTLWLPHSLTVTLRYLDKGIIEATAVDGKFVGLYTRVNGDGKMIFTLVWGLGDQLQYLARINYKTKDWKPYMSKGPHLEFLQSRVGAVIRAFVAKS